jgi:hypothetical protein
MSIREIAKSISQIRINDKYNCVFFNFEIIKNNKVIESYFVEGVYNQIPIDHKLGFLSRNYYLPFFDNEDDDNIIIIEEDNAIEVARSIKIHFNPFDKDLQFKITKEQ